MPPGRVGPFRNFQPYLYWSMNGKARNNGGRAAQRQVDRQNGNHAFSFNTGWQGGNVSDHVMYVLPMIEGSLLKRRCQYPWPSTTTCVAAASSSGV